MIRVEAASCHGLLLCSVLEYGNNRNGMTLVNPITLESMEIPKLCSSDNYSLGYDSFRDDYKIVSLLPGEDGLYLYRVDIYSVKSKTWRRLANPPSFFFPPILASGVYLNGCIHWWTVDGVYSSPVITAFNLAREEFEEIPLPVAISDFYELTVLDGCLAVLVDDEFCAAVVWVMKDYGVKDSWFIIKPGTDYPPDGENLELHEVLIGLVGDEVIMERDGRLVAYNWRNRVWRNLVIPGFPPDFIRMTGFIPSLVSPKYGEEHG